MALFLAKAEVSKIMLIGRWSSDAFLAYIRPQVDEWTSGMSEAIISVDDFHHQPLPAPNTPLVDCRHPDHPLMTHDPRSFSSNQSGFSFIGSHTDTPIFPRFSLFH
jgi:hypothetical protein